MKKLFIAVAVLFILNSLSQEVCAEELVIERSKEGANLFEYSFRKSLPIVESCGVVCKADKSYPLASKIIAIPGIEKVGSIQKYSITIIKAGAFSLEEIEEKLLEILKKQFRVRRIIIVAKK